MDENRKTINAWKMIYSLLHFVLKKMDSDFKEKNENVTENDVKDIIDYVKHAFENILRNTIEEKKLTN